MKADLGLNDSRHPGKSCSIVHQTMTPNSSSSDLRLQIVTGLLSDSSNAFETLYLHLTPLRGFFARRVGPVDAEDLYHDLILTLADQLKRGHLRQSDTLYKYASVIARRQLSAFFSKRNSMRLLEPEAAESLVDSAPGAEAACTAAEQVRIATRILAALPAREREILRRFYFDEHSAERIMQEMSLTATQFRLIKSRAKQRFAKACADSSSLHRLPIQLQQDRRTAPAA